MTADRLLRSTALMVSAAALAACGEGDGSTDAAANAPPTISGTPATSIVANTAYSFEPKATDPDGDALVFDVAGLPDWADFDSITGKLSGLPTDADVGTYKGIVVRVTDGTDDALLPAFDIAVEPVVASANESPTIEGTPAADAKVDSLYSFKPTASDPEGDALTFSVRNRPAWAAFDSSSGLLQGTPTASSVGTYSDIVISVFDGHSTVSMPPFSVRVSMPGTNSPPTISGDPSTSVAVGAPYTFTPTASDADGDTLTFSIGNLPAWANFDAATGQLSGIPSAGDEGTYADIAISASDGVASADLAPFTLTVTAPTTNTAPTISGTPSVWVLQGDAYDFLPSADDSDGDALTFAIANKPAWASFDTATGRLSGTPGGGTAGQYANIVISVSDGAAQAALPAFTITVAAQNSVPTISGSPAASVQAGDAYSFQPTAGDADGDALSFSVTGKPSWATFDAATGRLAGTPGAGDVGSYGNIVISVSDGNASAALSAFSIEVTAAPASNSAPTISGNPPTTATQGVQYSFTPSASDPDGDALTFSVSNRPTWATFNGSTGRLSGTPSSAGTYSNIVISVSDGNASAALPAFSIEVTAAPASNSAPTISGSPQTTATQGVQYSFTPSASDPDGDALTFSVSNRPTWATFNGSTGRLSGTPSSAGTYSNIVISVSDGQASASLAAFSITVAAVNAPPTISGTPPTTVTQDTVYTFTPTANDADGDTLTFGIQGKPSWASFSTSTGQLSGTPGAGDVGTSGNIVISVTDGAATSSLAAFSITVEAASTGSATLSWTAPTQRTDGSALTNLAGFKIYWGKQQGNYTNQVSIDNPGITTYVVDNLASGTWYFVTTAFDANGVESGFSNAASKTIP